MFENLTREQLEGILNALPIEFIFVDENDCLQYANKTETRARKTPPGIVGQDIRKCHKSASLPRVNEFISNLKSGKIDEEVFWVSYEQKILNRFFAVRDKSGKYLGIIEYLQDFNEMDKLAQNNKDAYKVSTENTGGQEKV